LPGVEPGEGQFSGPKDREREGREKSRKLFMGFRLLTADNGGWRRGSPALAI
jgi:hypothetical protein